MVPPKVAPKRNTTIISDAYGKIETTFKGATVTVDAPTLQLDP